MTLEDCIVILQNAAVVEQFNRIFELMITLTVTSLMKPFENRINEVIGNIKKLQKKAAVRSSKIDDLQRCNEDLLGKLKKTEAALNAAEQYSRHDNLIITGLPATLAEIVASTDDRNVDDSAASVDVANDVLQVPISPADISVAHSLRQQNSSSGPLPLLVRFTRRSIRDKAYRARFSLKNHNQGKPNSDRIYVNEDLIDANRRLFAYAKTLTKDLKFKGY